MSDEPTIAAVLSAIETVRDSINQRLDDVRADLRDDVQALRADHVNLAAMTRRIESNQLTVVTKVKEHDATLKEHETSIETIKGDYISKTKIVAVMAVLTAFLGLVGAAVAAVGHIGF